MRSNRFTLKNGLRVIFVPMKDNPTVTVLALVGVGSEDEVAPANGVAHFLEHMCFKGTERRPKALDIARELEDLGAASNAFTGRHYTGYYAKVQAKHAHKIFDVIADIYRNPLIPESEFEKEKGVIIEEIHMYDDMPRSRVDDVWTTLLYGDSPQGRSIASTEEVVKKLTRADLVTFRNTHYHPHNTVVVVAGQFDERTMKKDIEKMFGDIKRNKNTKRLKAPVTLTDERMSVLEKNSEQTHVILGVPAFPARHKHEPATAMLASILGLGMSSRLFEKVREEMGAAYYVYASVNAFNTYGNVTLHAGVPNARVREVVQALVREAMRVAKEGVSEQELSKAKNHATGLMMLGLESSDDLAEYYGMQEVLGYPRQTPAERIKEIRGVTTSDVRRIAKLLFTPEKFRLAMVGPKPSFTDIGEVLGV